MFQIPPKYRPQAYIWIWTAPIYLLFPYLSRHNPRDLIAAEFWLQLILHLLIGLAVAFAAALGFYVYYRFCLWFDRAVDRQAVRARLGRLDRAGELARVSSDPLYDREVDRSSEGPSAR